MRWFFLVVLILSLILLGLGGWLFGYGFSMHWAGHEAWLDWLMQYHGRILLGGFVGFMGSMAYFIRISM